MVVAVNRLFTRQKLIQAIKDAKCCLASKQAYQVSREANLMGVCSETSYQIQYIVSALYILESYVWQGDLNQISIEDAGTIISRLDTICGCADDIVDPLPEYAICNPICVSGTYIQDGGDPTNLVSQTVNPDISCNYVFTIEDPVNGELTYVIEKNEANWQLINTDFDVVSQITNANPNGNYTWSIDTVDYSITVTMGACS